MFLEERVLEAVLLEMVLLERMRYTRFARFAWSRYARRWSLRSSPGNERNMLLVEDLGEVLSCRILSSFFRSFFYIFSFLLSLVFLYIY